MFKKNPLVHPIRNSGKVITATILSFGIFLLILSFFYESFILAFIGIALIFWGALLFYIAIEHVPIELLNAATIPAMQNIERILLNHDVVSKGIYLSPKYLSDYTACLVFVPLTPQKLIPKPEDINKNSLYSRENSGLLLTPPGLALSKIMEQKMGTQFTQVTIDYLVEIAPKLLIEKTQMVDKIEINKDGNLIKITVTNNIFNSICTNMNELPLTHKTLGCAFTSAIACALTKATGKLVTINKEEKDRSGKLIVDYIVIDE